MTRPDRAALVPHRARLSRPALLAFVVLVAAITTSSWATPAGPLGHVVELAGTLGLTGLHVWLVSVFYRWIDARVRPRLVPFVATVVTALLGALLMLLVWSLAPRVFAPPLPSWSEILGSGALNGALLLGAYVLVVRHPRALEEVRASRLESELASLRARLEPHFLLNSLNAIAALVTSDPGRARRALAALGDLLAETVEPAADRPHTVADEIEWLRAYLTIFEARYDEALEIEWNVAPNLGALRLPRLLLQPLIENALVHGIAVAGAGHLSISLQSTAAGGLAVEIANSGPSISAGAVVEGNGLELVRRRLALELPGARFRLSPGPAGGTVAALELPPS